MKTFGFFVGELGAGGQETQLVYLLTELRKKDVSCALVVWDYQSKTDHKAHADLLESLGVDILLLSNQSIRSKLKLSRQFLSKTTCSSLQCFAFYLNFYCWLICLLTPMKPIGGIRNRLAQYRTSGFIRFWLCSLFPVLKISNNRKYQVGFANPMVKVIYSRTAVVTNQISVPPIKPDRDFTSDQVFQSVSVARLYPEKNIPLLLHGIANAVNAGVQINHVHAGTGALHDELVELRDQLGIQDHFRFLGEVDNIPSLLCSRNLFIHSSRYEGFPNVIMEAMCYALPIITTRCGDAEELVHNGVNGYFISMVDPMNLTSKLVHVQSNWDILSSFSENSYNMAKEKFGLEKLATHTMEAYAILLPQNHS